MEKARCLNQGNRLDNACGYRSMYIWPLYLWQEKSQFNVERKVFLTTGTGINEYANRNKMHERLWPFLYFHTYKVPGNGSKGYI